MTSIDRHSQPATTFHSVSGYGESISWAGRPFLAEFLGEGSYQAWTAFENGG
jgi:hypothetical protein